MAQRVLLVDDQTLFRQCLASFLQQHQIQVTGEAADGLEAVRMATELAPDVVLMDVRMPRCDGVEATRRIKCHLPHVRVVMLTVSEHDEDLFSALRAGASGYLLKTMEAEELLKAFALISIGESVISPSMASKLIHEFAGLNDRHSHYVEASSDELSERENEVLSLIARGRSNQEISETLCIAESTVKVHCRNIMEKLHLHNRVQIALHAIKLGIVDLHVYA